MLHTLQELDHLFSRAHKMHSKLIQNSTISKIEKHSFQQVLARYFELIEELEISEVVISKEKENSKDVFEFEPLPVYELKEDEEVIIESSTLAENTVLETIESEPVIETKEEEISQPISTENSTISAFNTNIKNHEKATKKISWDINTRAGLTKFFFNGNSAAFDDFSNKLSAIESEAEARMFLENYFKGHKSEDTEYLKEVLISKLRQYFL